jgi:hypothetical protein
MVSAVVWLQPVAMLLGLIMMSAIAHVSLSIRERPLEAVNRHINPVLGYAWALAALAACMVWVMPQDVLANGALFAPMGPSVVINHDIAGGAQRSRRQRVR